MLLDLTADLDRQAPGHERELRTTGSAPNPPLVLPNGWTLRPQGPGLLGNRIARAVREATREGVRSIVILGSDAPLLPAGLVGDAFHALETDDLVLAPAEDGGYVLIGFACGRLNPDEARHLLAGVPWGTAHAFRETRNAANAAGIRWRLLRRFWDVDRPEDLIRLQRLAARYPEQLSRVREALPVGDQFQTASSTA